MPGHDAPAPDENPPSAKPASPAHVGFLIALLFGLAVLKGLRMPSLWAVTHMTFNYSQGFLRRALFGQVLRIFSIFGERTPYRYNFLAGCAGLLLLLAGIALFRLVRRLLARDRGDHGLQAAMLVLAASPATVFLVHEIGYLDYVGIMAIPFFVVWAAGPRRGFAVFYVAMGLSICLALVHESMIVMFAPTMLFALLCHVLVREREASPRTRTLLWGHLGLATAVAFIASSVVGSVGTRGPETTDALQSSIAAYADFPLRGDGFDTLNRTLKENFFEILPRHWSNPENRDYLITTLVTYFPALAFLAYYGLRLLRRLPLAKKGKVLLGVVFLTAALAPLLLNFIGWDSARWSTVSLMATFFCLASMRLFLVVPSATSAGLAPGHRIDDKLTLTLAAVAIIAGLCTAYQGYLYDGFVVQWFPFRSQWETAIEVIRHGTRAIPLR